MLRSLRTRLVLVSLLPIVVAVAIAAALAVQTFNGYERSKTTEQLRRQARAIAGIYTRQGRRELQEPGAPAVLSGELREATAARLYYAPRSPIGGLPVHLRLLGPAPIDWKRLARGETQTLDHFRPPGTRRDHLVVLSGVYARLDRHGPLVGAMALATPTDDLAPSSRSIARRLAPAFLAGGAASILLALWLGTGLTRPLDRLIAAARQIGRGEAPHALDRNRRDEIGELNRAVGDMADELREAREHERLFLMRVSHELRTPLTAIQGHVQALADGVVDDPDDRQTSYAVIADEADRLGRLIADLLDLAKLEAHRFALDVEEVDLGALVRRGVHARRETARAAGIELVDDTADAPVVCGDGDRILQIVTNLLENALRWTPPGGTVRVSCLQAAGTARFEVADSGPGVPPELREAVLRPFFSEGVRGGTGLGLAIAVELAAAMGGRLTVADAPEGGALFACELPSRSASGRPTLPVA